MRNLRLLAVEFVSPEFRRLWFQWRAEQVRALGQDYCQGAFLGMLIGIVIGWGSLVLAWFLTRPGGLL